MSCVSSLPAFSGVAEDNLRAKVRNSIGWRAETSSPSLKRNLFSDIELWRIGICSKKKQPVLLRTTRKKGDVANERRQGDDGIDRLSEACAAAEACF